MGIKINSFIIWCRYTKASRRRERWYLDSGCLRHMTWDTNNFATLSRYQEGGTITFKDDSKSNIIGIGNIKIGSSSLIENVILVDGLKHNLLSISQLCDWGFKVIFDDSSCNVLDCKTDAYILSGFRENNVYIIDMSNLDWMLHV